MSLPADVHLKMGHTPNKCILRVTQLTKYHNNVFFDFLKIYGTCWSLSGFCGFFVDFPHHFPRFSMVFPFRRRPGTMLRSTERSSTGFAMEIFLASPPLAKLLGSYLPPLAQQCMALLAPGWRKLEMRDEPLLDCLGWLYVMGFKHPTMEATNKSLNN